MIVKLYVSSYSFQVYKVACTVMAEATAGGNGPQVHGLVALRSTQHGRK